MYVNYMNNEVSEKYCCSKCGVNNCKLWRLAHSLSVHLLCAKCCADEQNIDISKIDKNGCITSNWGGLTDQIGSYVPAIPDEEDLGYWGYTSIPEKAGIWWRNLPTL